MHDFGPDGHARALRALDALTAAERDGLVDSRGREILLTELGRAFARNVARVFDAHLTPPAGARAFSSTI